MAADAAHELRSISDVQLAHLISAGNAGAVRLLTQRNNQRLFRAAWSILKDRDEAEDAVQSGYLKALEHIAEFGGRASLSTWLTRIVVNEALARLRSAARRKARLERATVLDLDEYRERLMRGSIHYSQPDAALATQQVRAVLEHAIAELPDRFRQVFVLRHVEGMTVEETAEVLAIPPATVKTRLLRARRRLEQALTPELTSALAGAFPFAGADCARMTDNVVTIFLERASL